MVCMNDQSLLQQSHVQIGDNNTIPLSNLMVHILSADIQHGSLSMLKTLPKEAITLQHIPK